MTYLMNYIVACGLLFLYTQAATAFKFHYKTSLSNSFHLNQLQRMKREAPKNASANANPDHDPDACIVKCLRSTEEKLGALQEEESAGKQEQESSALSPQSTLTRDYDPKDFEKLCNAYRPGRECLNTCETTELKTAALKGMALLQFMCVDRYEDFKANLPCMNNASAQAEVVCKPNCSQFESSVGRLEELSNNRELVVSLKQKELSSVLAGSCQYVECLGICGNPITKKQCGKNVAELDEQLVKNVFNSLRHTVTSLGAGDQLPKECLKLGDK